MEVLYIIPVWAPLLIALIKSSHHLQYLLFIFASSDPTTNSTLIVPPYCIIKYIDIFLCINLRNKGGESFCLASLGSFHTV